jgi:hypothetical protein
MAGVGLEFYLLTLLSRTAGSYLPLRAGLAFVPLALRVAVSGAGVGRAIRR